MAAGDDDRTPHMPSQVTHEVGLFDRFALTRSSSGYARGELRDLASVVRLATTRPGLLLRHSRGPDWDLSTERSVDQSVGVDMPGLSVAHLTPELWWPLDPTIWVARRIAEYARPGTDAFAWILDGRQVAQGPDHEPLVRECRPVARLTDSVVAEACNVWRTASGHDRCERPRPG